MGSSRYSKRAKNLSRSTGGYGPAIWRQLLKDLFDTGISNGSLHMHVCLQLAVEPFGFGDGIYVRRHNFHSAACRAAMMHFQDVIKGDLVLGSPFPPMSLINQFSVDENTVEIGDDCLAIHYPSKFLSISLLQLPAWSICAGKELIIRFMAGDPHRIGVVIHPATGTESDVSKIDGLGHGLCAYEATR